MNTFSKNESGVVINNNKPGLLEARRRKKHLQDKDEKINKLEKKMDRLEESIQLILSKLQDK